MSIEHLGKWEGSIQAPHFDIFIAFGFYLNKTIFFLDYIFFCCEPNKELDDVRSEPVNNNKTNETPTKLVK